MIRWDVLFDLVIDLSLELLVLDIGCSFEVNQSHEFASNLIVILYSYFSQTGIVCAVMV